jgi:hypothetical protein
VAAQCQGYMSTISRWDLPSTDIELPLLGPRATSVIDRVKSGETNLIHHPDVADKLFVHYIHLMPSDLVRGPLENALDWIEEKISETC